jgi:putative nucleotidyltransferase with HDIG domain
MQQLSKPSSLVNLYVSCVVTLGGVCLAVVALWDQSASVYDIQGLLGLFLFLVLGLVLERSQHRLAMGSAAGSIAFVVYLASAVVFGTFWCVLIAASSLAIAEYLIRKPVVKIVFNVAQHILALGLAGLMYTTLGGAVPPDSLDSAAVPYMSLALTYILVNSGVVSGVVALSERRNFSEVWVRNTWGLLGYDLVASAVGLGIAWLYLTWGVMGVLAVVIPVLFLRHTYLVNLQLQATNRELLELMVKSIEARDPYTSGHSQRVAEIARLLARELGLHFREVDSIATAALLHDVGKIYEEFAPILQKTGKLTAEEREVMCSHPVKSADLVATISNLRGYVERCVRHHHENFDGTGYPDGLSGEEIPLGARIILVADTADAMTTDRPYRKALSYERLIEELEKYAGTQFDPRVVSAFKRSSAVARFIRRLAPRSECVHVVGSDTGATESVRAVHP